jgi:hypothetical protein
LRARSAAYFGLQIVTGTGGVSMFLCFDGGEWETLPDVAAVEALIAQCSEPSVVDLDTMANQAPPKRGRGKSQKSLDLIDAAYDILEELQPTTVRSVCYQLFLRYPDGRFITSMTDKNQTGRVSKQLVWARENKLIPWEWIVDESCQPEVAPSWRDPESIINAAVRSYRKNHWQTQPNRVQVWSEKGTVRGKLKPVLDKFGVTFQVLGGFGGGSTVHDVAELSISRDDDGQLRPLTILYVGDYDPSGMCMSEVDLPRRFDRYGGSIEIRRIAITAADIADLPTFAAADKKKDSRYKWFVANYGPACCELDALSTVVLRQRVEDAIVSLLDMDAWNRSLRLEAAESESMKGVLEAWPSISRQGAKYSPKGSAP